MCSQTRIHIRLDMCLTIMCGKADVRPALSDTRRVYQSDLQDRLFALHYHLDGAGRSSWSDASEIEMVLGDLTSLGTYRFRVTGSCTQSFRCISFGHGAGGTALPARRSHDKIRFFLPHTRRAASQSRMDEPRRVSPHGPAMSPGRYVATTCTVWLGRRDQ